MKKTTLLASCLMGAAAFAQSTFNYTGAPQYYVVPPVTSMIFVDVRGAEGGTATNLTQSPNTALGGLGGRVQASVPVTPGDTIWIYVGGKGVGSGGTLTCYLDTGGWNGGGDGYSGFNSFNYNSGGGGGASDLRLNGQGLSNRIIVSGGGGGGGCSGCTGGGYNGGHGGDTLGQDGVNSTCTPGCQNGKGGGQVAGGGRGQWACQCNTVNSTAGSLGVGGMADGSGCAVNCGSGGGGGGGYYGGGGGSLGPGGGGSSYAYSSATSVIHTQGYQTGHGQVILQANTGMDVLNQPTHFILFPNPAEQYVSIYLPSQASTSGQIQIFDMTGKLVHSFSWNGENSIQLDLSKWVSGSYAVTLITEHGSYMKKLLKN